MLVRMTTWLAWYGTECQAGETINLPEADALAFIRTGQAERVADEPAASPRPLVESAALASPQQNTMKQHMPQLKRRG